MVNQISEDCKQLLLDENIDILSDIEFDVNGSVHTLTFEYIIDTYMQASREAQLVFITALKKAMSTNEMGIDKFFEGMGQLLLMTHLSEKFEA